MGCFLAMLLLGESKLDSPQPSTTQQDPLAVGRPNDLTNGPIEREFQEILERDDAIQRQVSEWIASEETSADSISQPFRLTLRARMDQKFQPIRDAYVDFLIHHPEHARARLAFGSFLSDLGEENEAIIQTEKARDLDPNNPAAWNNLAGLYARTEKVVQAFPCYTEAIRLNPSEPSYPHSLGTLTCLFPREAATFYHCEKAETLSRATTNFQTACRLAPRNFEYAQDFAETFYGIQLPIDFTREKREELSNLALSAWTNAMEQAELPIQREGVYLHQARWHLKSGSFDLARECLGKVTNAAYREIKSSLEQQLLTRMEVSSHPLPLLRLPDTSKPEVHAIEGLQITNRTTQIPEKP